MKRSSTPARGMRDLLPQEVILREEVMERILQVYRRYGFERIETPILEHIELLTGGEGGENETLIFKVLKRGTKITSIDKEINESDLVDLGLRFDLTVPLSRYYANNRSKLMHPFKAIQIGSVWRADKPQRGRYRQFTQCDIDIIGLNTIDAEIELIIATSEALMNLEFNNFTIRINDRRILKGIVEYCGYDVVEYDSVLISLDKIDKIGLEGVYQELTNKGFDDTINIKFINIFRDINHDHLSFNDICLLLPNTIEGELYHDIHNVIDIVTSQSQGKYKIVFDPTLVRGMSYYTGQIFEIQHDDFPSSIAGGGRYDKMIGKYLGKDIPACGFSIGFERIITLLEDKKHIIPNKNKNIALLFRSQQDVKQAIINAQNLRSKGYNVLMIMKNKNFSNQLSDLANKGFSSFTVVNTDGTISEIKETS